MIKYIGFIVLLCSACKGLISVPEPEVIESERIVLLEEMTGVSCPNCPKGTAEIEAIKEIYKNQVIPVGIHGFFLSWPTDKSKFDFRNDFAKDLEQNLAPGTSKPAALINRASPTAGGDRVISSPDLWLGIIEEQLKIPPKVGIETEIKYDSTSRKLVINAGIIGLADVNEAMKISVMILENNIIDAQKDLKGVIEDFHHNHVLRTMLTPYTGEDLASSIKESEVVSKTYEFTLPEDESLWKWKDIEVVIFVHEARTDGIILQANLSKLF